ncbi:pyridoxal-phosphate dependent enzyme [Sulfurisphaera javensis]|uniref:Pyridoxal-phosphate dependent enzyme n=1 Tax=Sulfurisphaera javensis TaxID=2049879 RepID=A0AAT9GUU3_9CREN
MEICTRCGKPRESIFEIKCKRCGGPFKYVIDFDYKDKIRENFPYVKEWISLGEGNTPLIKFQNVYLKLDFLNPTGSYKDRGSVTLISYLHQQGIKRIAEDSSGNAGASIAAYGALAGMEVAVFVPENANPSKLKQIEAYNAKVVKVKGSREDVTRQAENSGYYFASHILQPQFRDGIRSLAYEIYRDFKQVEYVFLPTSAGTLLLGVYEGFKHLLESGKIERMPKLISVQTEQVMPVCASLKGLKYNPPEKVTSIADALVSTKPFLLPEMLTVLKETGDCVVVSEDEIKEAWKYLAKHGILVEPSSATVWSAYQKYKVNNAVLVLTGNGLKSLSVNVK